MKRSALHFNNFISNVSWGNNWETRIQVQIYLALVLFITTHCLLHLLLVFSNQMKAWKRLCWLPMPTSPHNHWSHEGGWSIRLGAVSGAVSWGIHKDLMPCFPLISFASLGRPSWCPCWAKWPCSTLQSSPLQSILLVHTKICLTFLSIWHKTGDPKFLMERQGLCGGGVGGETMKDMFFICVYMCHSLQVAQWWRICLTMQET